MTFLDVAVQYLSHPFQRFKNPGIFDHHVAVMVSPTQVVGLMVRDAEPQFGNVKQIQLRHSLVMDATSFGLLHAVEESLGRQFVEA